MFVIVIVLATITVIVTNISLFSSRPTIFTSTLVLCDLDSRWSYGCYCPPLAPAPQALVSSFLLLLLFLFVFLLFLVLCIFSAAAAAAAAVVMVVVVVVVVVVMMVLVVMVVKVEVVIVVIVVIVLIMVIMVVVVVVAQGIVAAVGSTSLHQSLLGTSPAGPCAF